MSNSKGRQIPDSASVNTPPNNVEAERKILGAMMLSSDVLGDVLEEIDSRHFYLESHRTIFRAIKRLFNKGKPIDAIHVSQELQTGKKLERIGGLSYLSDLCSDVTTPTLALSYLEIIKKTATLRELIRAGQEITKLGYSSPFDDVGETLDRAEATLYDISSSRIKDRFSHIGELIQETYEHLDNLQQSGLETTGIPTHFRDVDKILLGLHPSDLIIVAARPTMGKTSFVLSVARNISINSKIPVGIFSLEMSKFQITQRLLSSESHIRSDTLRTGKLTRDDRMRLLKAMERLSEAPIYIDDTPSIGVIDLRTKARRLRNKANVELIIVDYLQLMSGDSRSENRQQQISEISRALKILGRELEIPIIAVSQLSRAVEKRENKKPLLSDLRESGAIEQDADVVMFLYRKDYYEDTQDIDDRESVVDLIIRKHRNGPIGTVRLGFIKEYTKFFDLEVSETF